MVPLILPLVVQTRTTPEERILQAEYETAMYRFRPLLRNTRWSEYVTLKKADAQFLVDESGRLKSQMDKLSPFLFGVFAIIERKDEVAEFARFRTISLLSDLADGYTFLIRLRQNKVGQSAARSLGRQVSATAGFALEMDACARQLER